MEKINARLGDEHGERFATLMALEGGTATQVIKKAIDALYEQKIGNPQNSGQRLLASDFFASCDDPTNGPTNDSENYKDIVSEQINAKLANH